MSYWYVRIGHYVTKDTFRSIYFAIFSSLLTYGCQIWGQIKSNNFVRLERLQNRAINILNFANFHDLGTPLYKVSKNILPSALKNTFKLTANSHDYLTHSSVQHEVIIP